MDVCMASHQTAPPVRVRGTPLTQAERYKLVYDFQQLKSVHRVATANNVDPRTVRRWVLAFSKTGAVERKPGSGRKRLLDDSTLDKATTMLLSGKYSGVQAVVNALHAQGAAPNVSRTTLSRRVKAKREAQGMPIHVVRGEPQRALSDATKAKRLQFALANRSTNWDRVMFTDRKKFLFKYPGCQKKSCYWAEKGQKPRVNKVNNPMAVNVYAGITKWGITKVHFVAGTSKLSSSHTTIQGKPARNITKSGYKEVLEATLLPEGSKLFRNKGVSSWVLQQDNDPCHKSAGNVVLAWQQAHPGMHVTVLPAWPGNSPDLNPIENLWAWAQAQVDARGCQSFDEFKQCVVQTLKSVPQKMLHNLVCSMKIRIAACIEKQGDKLAY